MDLLLMEPEAEAVEMIPESLASLAYGTLYYVYFDQPPALGALGPAGGTVTYETTTNKATAMQGTNRYFIGSIVTAVSGGSNTTGNGDGGSGPTQTQNNPSVFLGAYSSATDYLVGNQVTYVSGGAEGLYQCIQPCVNVAPTNTTYWTLVSILLPAAVPTSSVINTTIPRTSSGSVSIFSASIDIPASGGPYRILASYAVYVSSTFASNGLDTWLSDGTSTFGFFEYFENSGMNGSTICSSCCGYSPAYNAGAGTITITLYAQNNANSTSTLTVVSGAKEGPGTSNLTLAVIQAQ